MSKPPKISKKVIAKNFKRIAAKARPKEPATPPSSTLAALPTQCPRCRGGRGMKCPVCKGSGFIQTKGAGRGKA